MSPSLEACSADSGSLDAPASFHRASSIFLNVCPSMKARNALKWSGARLTMAARSAFCPSINGRLDSAARAVYVLRTTSQWQLARLVKRGAQSARRFAGFLFGHPRPTAGIAGSIAPNTRPFGGIRAALIGRS